MCTISTLTVYTYHLQYTYIHKCTAKHIHIHFLSSAVVCSSSSTIFGSIHPYFAYGYGTLKHICIYTKSVFIKNDNHLEIRASEEHTKSYLKNTMVRRLLFWADRVSYYSHNIHYYKTFYFTTNYKTNATFLYMTWRSTPCFLVQGKPILVFWKTKTTASAGEKEREKRVGVCLRFTLIYKELRQYWSFHPSIQVWI